MLYDPLRTNYSSLQLWLLKHPPIVSRLGIPAELFREAERAVASGRETDCTAVLLRIKEYERDKADLESLEANCDEAKATEPIWSKQKPKQEWRRILNVSDTKFRTSVKNGTLIIDPKGQEKVCRIRMDCLRERLGEAADDYT